ncbi:MAG: tRNA pseudouridine synthase A [Candidatus Wallbacteria bacterium]
MAKKKFTNFNEDILKTIVMKIEYDGTDYFGFQKQAGREHEWPSVQGKIERALRSILGFDVSTKGSGRTDRGVHALSQIISFGLKKEHEIKIPPEGLKQLLNTKLAGDIIVRNVKVVDGDFHARGCAVSKTYVYIVNYGVASVFMNRYSWHFKRHIDMDRIHSMMKNLKGRLFAAPFCDGEINFDGTETYYRDVNFFRAYDIKSKKIIVFLIEGEGFLHKMVRRLVGFLMDYASGRFDEQHALKIIKDYSMRSTYVVAPPNGLFLYKVKYENVSM